MSPEDKHARLILIVGITLSKNTWVKMALAEKG
jgi:hypothetical protein